LFFQKGRSTRVINPNKEEKKEITSYKEEGSRTTYKTHKVPFFLENSHLQEVILMSSIISSTQKDSDEKIISILASQILQIVVCHIRVM